MDIQHQELMETLMAISETCNSHWSADVVVIAQTDGKLVIIDGLSERILTFALESVESMEKKEE